MPDMQRDVDGEAHAVLIDWLVVLPGRVSTAGRD